MCNPLYDSVKIIWAACIVETNDKKVATPTQNNQALQKQITQLEHSNVKKSLKVKQLIGTLSQYKHKQCQHISKIHAAACKPSLADSQSLKASIQTIIMKNKCQYTTHFINM